MHKTKHWRIDVLMLHLYGCKGWSSATILQDSRIPPGFPDSSRITLWCQVPQLTWMCWETWLLLANISEMNVVWKLNCLSKRYWYFRWYMIYKEKACKNMLSKATSITKMCRTNLLQALQIPQIISYSWKISRLVLSLKVPNKKIAKPSEAECCRKFTPFWSWQKCPHHT